jgi:hypothetical protein
VKEKDVGEAEQKSQADPGNVQWARAAAQARAAHDEAMKSASDAETKHQVAQQAAAEVNGLTDLENIARASKALEEALAAGRELAAKYPDPLLHVENAVAALPAGHTRESLSVLVSKTRREVMLASEKVASAEHQICETSRERPSLVRICHGQGHRLVQKMAAGGVACDCLCPGGSRQR